MSPQESCRKLEERWGALLAPSEAYTNVCIIRSDLPPSETCAAVNSRSLSCPRTHATGGSATAEWQTTSSCWCVPSCCSYKQDAARQERPLSILSFLSFFFFVGETARSMNYTCNKQENQHKPSSKGKVLGRPNARSPNANPFGHSHVTP